MIGRWLSCSRFRRLASERHDRHLNLGESRFLAHHREGCRRCAEAELQGAIALNMLREAALDPVPSASFDERVMRLFRLRRNRESLRYWSPALAGAVIAGITVLAAMQVITRSVEGRQSYGETGAYRYERQSSSAERLPSLLLPEARTDE